MARAGFIGGFDIGLNDLTGAHPSSSGGRFSLNPDGGYIAFLNDRTGSFSGIGESVVSAATGVKVLARFANLEDNAGGTNIGAIVTASGGSQNIALDVTTGAVRMGGAQYHNHIRTSAGSGYGMTEQDYIVIIEDNGATSGSYYLPTAGRTVNRRIIVCNQSRVAQTVQGNGVNIKSGLNSTGSISLAAGGGKIEFIFRSDGLWQIL